MSDLVAVILAAGKGTRMRSSLPKVLHKVAGKPMLDHVLQAAETAGADKKVVVAGFASEQVAAFVGPRADIVVQAEQLGTGHAVLQTASLLRDYHGTVMIICGDTPLLDGEELKAFYRKHLAAKAAATVLTAVVSEPDGYGRVLRNAAGNVTAIVEEKDTTDEEKAICEINTGIYCIESPLLFEALSSITCSNAQGEYYLTDVLASLDRMGQKVAGVTTGDTDMILGINSRRQLAEAEAIMRRRVLDRLMDEGVTIMDPASTFIEPTVEIGRDSIIYPFTWLEGCTKIGPESEIGPQVRLTDVLVGSGSKLQFVYGHDCLVGSKATIGPYVHLRPDTVIEEGVKLGNFVEVKNSHIGSGSKVPHLSYIGDSDVGSGVNIGCGCVTVNYDGRQKHRTVIEDGAFIGCNSNLVAPVTIGEGAYVAAGSTVTKNVPSGDLGVARAKQSNIKGWAAKRREP